MSSASAMMLITTGLIRKLRAKCSIRRMAYSRLEDMGILVWRKRLAVVIDNESQVVFVIMRTDSQRFVLWSVACR